MFLKTDGAGNLSFDSLSFATPLAVIGNATAGSEIRLPEDTDNGSNYVAIKAPDNLASNLTLTLPSADGTSGQVLQTNGSGVLSFSSPSSDFVLLATTDASSSATVSFDGYFSSTYKNYQIIISDVYPATANTTLSCRFRRSNADVTASSYSAVGRRTHLASTNVSDGRYASSASSIDVLTNSSPNSASRTTAINVMIYNPLSTASYKKVSFLVIGASDDGGGTNAVWNVNNFGQLVDNTNALSGITFYYSSGNIASGNFKLYGIK